MAGKAFGHIPGQAVGTNYANRAALAAAGVHPPTVQGIHGTQRDGADSIVVSGGYVDDEDHGDLIIYTGAGGNDPSTKKQVQDQTVSHPNNAGLITSELMGAPVRVTRGAKSGSKFAPASGYRYDGLYSVVSHWIQVGKDGYKIVRFRLEALPEGTENGPGAKSDSARYSSTTVVRRIRDSAESRKVKAWYGDACQVCGVQLPVDGDRYYSEGAHIRPLGRPHVGPDNSSNILCLCPNHHVMLDKGGLSIGANFDVHERTTGVPLGKLTVHAQHAIDPGHLQYLNSQVFPPP